MELHHLRYIVTLARQLHFSQAARELNITQPSLSQCVLQAEQELGVRLFERKTRSVALTEAGREFVRQAERVLSEWDGLYERMRRQANAKQAPLRIGTLLNMAKLSLNNRVLSFQQLHPDISVSIHEVLGSIELIRQLEKDVFDAVFFIPSPELKAAPGLELQPVLQGRVVAIVPRTHRFAKLTSIHIAELAGEKLIFPAKSHSLFEIVMSACRDKGFEPQIVALVSMVNTGIEMAAQGIGISLVSSQFVGDSCCDAVAVIPVEPTIDRPILMAYKTRPENSRAIHVFRDFILRQKLDCSNPDVTK